MDLPILIVLAVVCIAIGFALDNLLHSLRGEKGGREPVSSPGEAAPDRDGVVQPEPVYPAPSGSDTGLEEVFRIWRDQAEKDLVVEVRGNKARSPSELNRNQLDLLGAALQELSTWLGRGVSPEPIAPLSPKPAGQPEAILGQEEGQLIEDSTLEEIRRPNFNPLDMVTNALRADIRRPPRPSDRSLAAQVDVVLQEKLRGTPLEKRGIRLLDAPDGGLLVQVGFDRFAGIEEVPDMEIKEMIRSAVVEWGKRTTPGR